MNITAAFSPVLRLILPAMLLMSWGPPLVAAQEPIPEDTVITLQRGNCETGCPVYRVVIFEDGDVILQGRARVRRLGVVSTHIGRDRVRQLLQEFRAIDYLHLDNIYGYRGKGCTASKPSMPMVITSLSSAGSSSTLTHHAGCVGEISDRLTALESGIDQAVDSARWMTGPKRLDGHRETKKP